MLFFPVHNTWVWEHVGFLMPCIVGKLLVSRNATHTDFYLHMYTSIWGRYLSSQATRFFYMLAILIDSWHSNLPYAVTDKDWYSFFGCDGVCIPGMFCLQNMCFIFNSTAWHLSMRKVPNHFLMPQTLSLQNKNGST